MEPPVPDATYHWLRWLKPGTVIMHTRQY